MFKNDSNDVITEIAHEIHGGWTRELAHEIAAGGVTDNFAEESLASARSAVYHALRGLNAGITRERIAELIHEERNSRRGAQGEHVSFARLSHGEREREFTILETTLRILQKHRVI